MVSANRESLATKNEPFSSICTWNFQLDVITESRLNRCFEWWYFRIAVLRFIERVFGVGRRTFSQNKGMGRSNAASSHLHSSFQSSGGFESTSAFFYYIYIDLQDGQVAVASRMLSVEYYRGNFGAFRLKYFVIGVDTNVGAQGRSFHLSGHIFNSVSPDSEWKTCTHLELPSKWSRLQIVWQFKIWGGHCCTQNSAQPLIVVLKSGCFRFESN